MNKKKLSNKTKNILILIPGENARGGITNYYLSIKKHLHSHILFFPRGSRNWPQKESKPLEIIRLVNDYLKFILKLLFNKVALVQITTAFYAKSILRDGMFIIISKILRKKVIVFYRGWGDDFVCNLSGLSLKLYKKVFFKADAIIDLAKKNINYLKKMGYRNKIFLETTLVDIDLVNDINIANLIQKRIDCMQKTILFLSRIEKEKGIYKVLDIYNEIKKGNPDFKLVFAGDGSETENLKNKIIELNVEDVSLMGFVTGEQKKQLFENATIFLFLSDFEGMPNAVLEAMAFGLPVITTNVGGISSVFVNKKNGVLLEDYDQLFIISEIKRIVSDNVLYNSISITNYNEAKQKFWSNIVATRMMKIFDKIITEN